MLMAAAAVAILVVGATFMMMKNGKGKKAKGTPTVATRTSSRLAGKTPVRAAASPARAKTPPKSALKTGGKTPAKTPKGKKTYLADVNSDGA